jgi:hypothetical protein
VSAWVCNDERMCMYEDVENQREREREREREINATISSVTVMQ